MKAEWRDIEGYKGIYQVSSQGKVRKLKSSGEYQYLNMGMSTDGYRRQALTNTEGVRSGHLKVHRLVAQAFIPNPENKPTVDHINGDKLNNTVENLRWATMAEQNRWSIEIGLKNIAGEHNGASKLRNSDVEDIIGELLKQDKSITEIAKHYSIAISAISSINTGRKWSSVLPDVQRPIREYKRKKTLTTQEVENIIHKLQTTPRTFKNIAVDTETNPDVIKNINNGRHYKQVLPHIQRPIRKKSGSKNKEIQSTNLNYNYGKV